MAEGSEQPAAETKAAPPVRRKVGGASWIKQPEEEEEAPPKREPLAPVVDIKPSLRQSLASGVVLSDDEDEDEDEGEEDEVKKNDVSETADKPE